MTLHFNREFTRLDEEHMADLESLEQEGCVYAYLFQDELDDFAKVRIRLHPAEVVRYVDALYGYEEFRRGIARGLPPDQALAQVSATTVRHSVEAYNEYTSTTGQGGMEYCPAAFLGFELERLICTNVPERHEVLGRSYTADRRFLLEEVISSLPSVASFLANRHAGRPPYVMENEQDLRDLTYAIIKPILSDATIEDVAPKLAGGSKRIDIVISTIKTAIEFKYVRDSSHARRVADELRTDIESYHSHPSCRRLVCVVWDINRVLPDREALQRDLSGARQKGASAFVVEVRVIP